MLNKKIGFIGAGNMATAIAAGLISSGNAAEENIYVTDIDVVKAGNFCDGKANVTENAKALATACDTVILAVKPQVYDVVLNELADIASPLYISIAAGISIDYISEFFSGKARVIRAMPNSPALINEGMTVISAQSEAAQDDVDTARQIFESVGLVMIMQERYMNSVVAVSSSSPAYVFMMIEAMSDAAVRDGIPRDIAYQLAAQAVAGSAKMVLQTNQHPAVLKDNVCSPGGTTIRAVAQLEKDGFRSAIINAMGKCTERAEELGKFIMQRTG